MSDSSMFDASVRNQLNTRFHWTYYLLIASALSIGWGIRGNFGHEWGAAMPGALSVSLRFKLCNKEFDNLPHKLQLLTPLQFWGEG